MSYYLEENSAKTLITQTLGSGANAKTAFNFDIDAEMINLPSQSSAKTLNGRFVGKIPSAQALGIGDIIIASGVLLPGMCINNLNAYLPDLSTAGYTARLALIKGTKKANFGIYANLSGASGAGAANSINDINGSKGAATAGYMVGADEHVRYHPLKENCFIGWVIGTVAIPDNDPTDATSIQAVATFYCNIDVGRPSSYMKHIS